MLFGSTPFCHDFILLQHKHIQERRSSESAWSRQLCGVIRRTADDGKNPSDFLLCMVCPDITSKNEDDTFIGQALSKSLDFIIDSASGDHPFDPYLSLLKTAGVLVLVGGPSEVKFSPGNLLIGMKTISGSATGGTKDIQEMLDFCAAHGIYPEIEVIPIQYANEALDRLIKKDVRYRFVIDIGNSLK